VSHVARAPRPAAPLAAYRRLRGFAAKEDITVAERRRARRDGSAAKIVRVTAPGRPTNGRRLGLALFEREITA
jgi:hypothetical protein